MPATWERRRILIWGKTRPELSQKYREVVCTGGVFADTKRLVRLYPIPLRYMDDERWFRKYQWIQAYVTRAESDPRPESYKIRADSIEIGEFISTERGGNWDKRAAWIMQPQNVFPSVEALQEKQRLDNTSLGIIRPRTIVRVYAEPFGRAERESFWQRYQQVVAQMELPLDPETQRPVKPLSPPDYRFKVVFRCDDQHCRHDHDFSILDWEVDALYARLRNQGLSERDAAQGVVNKLRYDICGPDKDLHFFLGNIATHPHVFTVVGLWSPKKKQGGQLTLFN